MAKAQEVLGAIGFIILLFVIILPVGGVIYAVCALALLVHPERCPNCGSRHTKEVPGWFKIECRNCGKMWSYESF